MYLAQSCPVRHAPQIWSHCLIRFIVKAREFANIRMIAIEVLVVFLLATEPCRCFIYDKLLVIRLAYSRTSKHLTIFFAGKTRDILTDIFRVSINDKTS